MSSHLFALLDWTFADLSFLGIAVWQYVSISRDLKRTKAEAARQAALEEDKKVQG